MALSNEQNLFLFCSVMCVCLIADAIDCRKFVFAPRCRGVSAKRSSPKISNDELSGDIEEAWIDSIEEPFYASRKNSNQKILEKLLEKLNEFTMNEN